MEQKYVYEIWNKMPKFDKWQGTSRQEYYSLIAGLAQLFQMIIKVPKSVWHFIFFFIFKSNVFPMTF
jgi:hypothetical protein